MVNPFFFFFGRLSLKLFSFKDCSCEAARWLMASARMFRRRNRLTHSGPPQWRYGPAEGLLLRDNVERVGDRARVGRARCHKRRRVASGRMGRTNPRTTTKGRAIAQDETQPRYRGQGRGGLVYFFSKITFYNLTEGRQGP